jgi:hypothetical protein
MRRRGFDKRKRPPEEIASSASLEVIAVDNRGGRLTKKRTIEKTKFELRVSPSLPDNVETLSSPVSRVDLEPPGEPDAPKGSPTSAPSRSVSVSTSHARHVIACLPPSRPEFKSGSHIDPSTSMSSFVGKLLLLEICPAPHVNCLESIAVSPVFPDTGCVRAACFRVTGVLPFIGFRYIFNIIASC